MHSGSQKPTAKGRRYSSPGRGPGSPQVDSVVAAHRSEAARKGHPFEQSGNVAGLFNCVRIGDLPVGDSRHTWTGAEFWKGVS